MAYQVLYRKYRPRSFDEVVGQSYIIQTLKNAIYNNQIAHAYLFAGPRGTGKTSTAKLFAKMVNCTCEDHKPCDHCDNCEAFNNGNHPDIFELDAASNNKVDDIRQLIENVIYAPVVGKYKVYIIDEVHMLSTSAFNAFLKTLEEPPENVIFILATTEPQKIIPTVLSRCQRYNFTKVETPEMRKRLVYILEQEDIQYDEEALELIMSLSDGGMRDVLSILEQVLAYGNNELRTSDVNRIYGLLTNSEKVKLLVNLKMGKIEEVMVGVRSMYKNGINIKRLTSDFIEILKECLIYKETKNTNLMKFNTAEQADTILQYYDTQSILAAIDILVKTIDTYQITQDVLSYFEIALLKIETLANNGITEQIIQKPVIKEKVQPIKEVVKPITPVVQETKPVVETVPVVEEAPIVVEAPAVPSEEVVPEVSEPAKPKSSFFNDLPQAEVAPITDEEEMIAPTKELEFETVDTSNEFLLSILFNADREEKNNDMVIYHRLSDFRLEPAKRKFFNYLKGTEIFASQKDAIIFCCLEDSQVSQINDLQNNRELYFFLKEEFGIDKMSYAINPTRKKELATEFVRLRNNPNGEIKKIEIKKYQTNEIPAPLTIEDKLTDFFGEVSVEEK